MDQKRGEGNGPRQAGNRNIRRSNWLIRLAPNPGFLVLSRTIHSVTAAGSLSFPPASPFAPYCVNQRFLVSESVAQGHAGLRLES